MSFFGSSDSNKKPSLARVRTTVVKTQNVAKELLSISESNNVPLESIDFNLLDLLTYTRMREGEKEVEWEEIPNEELYELDDESALLNDKFEIKQIYEIEIFSKDPKDNKFSGFNIAVGANATKCKVYLSIKSGSTVEYFKGFEQELATLINNKKLRAGILINIFDEMLSDVLSKLAARVKVEQKVQFSKNETILIAQSIEPTPTIDDALILHYDQKEELSEHQKIDYSQRGFIRGVVKDELLIEYIKPKKGVSGRSATGKFLEAKEPLETNVPEFSITDTIQMRDNNSNIEYRAKGNGYITFEENTYTIKTEVDVDAISFKTTGSITAGVDSEVNMNVKEIDTTKDAVGKGMKVEVSNIEIEGNTGPNSVVHAQKASVGGQTHKDSEIRASKLDINVHKGKAFGKNIHVSRLEHGIIDGDMVEVSQAVGGDIRAKEVHIEICGSYVKATASRLIDIGKLQGTENIFTIDSLLKKSAKQGLKENEDEIKNLEMVLRDIKKEIEKYTEMIESNKKSFLELKKRLLHYKKNGVKMPESFVSKYQQFIKIEKHLAAIKQEYAVKNDKHILLTTQTASFQDSIFDARIVNHDRWTGYNKLVFKLVDPPVEVVYEPPEGSPEMIFALVEDMDGNYSIQAVKEA